MEPTLVHSNEHHLIARLDTITFCIWKTRTTLLGIEKCCESYLAASAGATKPAAAFGIIFEQCEIPDAPVRKAIVDSFDNPAHNLKAVLALIEGKGLSFTAKRAALMGMSVLTQKNVIVHTFAGVEDAAKHVQSKLSTLSQLAIAQAASGLMARARES